MGYSTKYYLDIDVDETFERHSKCKECGAPRVIETPLIDTVKFELGTDIADRISLYNDFDKCMDSSIPIKWYEHNSDMVKLSEKFPDVTFTLRGIGEEHYYDGTEFVLDVWQKTYKDGVMTVGEIKYRRGR